MNLLKQYWEQNKKGYIISSGLTIFGGILILLFMETISEVSIIFIVIGSPIALFIFSFGLFLIFGKKEGKEIL